MDNIDLSKKDLVRQGNARKISLKNNLLQVSNNHFRIHSPRGIEIQGNNKWITLIQNAKFSSSKVRGGERK